MCEYNGSIWVLSELLKLWIESHILFYNTIDLSHSYDDKPFI